jgi:hypothetical protein
MRASSGSALEPVEQPEAHRADDRDLGEVNVGVDEAGQQDPSRPSRTSAPG